MHGRIRGELFRALPGFGQNDYAATAYGISSSDEVVGSLYGARDGPRAFVYLKGHSYDLNTLIAPKSGWQPECDGRRFDDAAARPDDRETLAEIALWVNRFLARSPSRLLMVQLEDLLGDVEQINMPTTTDEHPNWRKRTSIVLEDLPTDPRFTALASALQRERGS